MRAKIAVLITHIDLTPSGHEIRILGEQYIQEKKIPKLVVSQVCIVECDMHRVEVMRIKYSKRKEQMT